MGRAWGSAGASDSRLLENSLVVRLNSASPRPNDLAIFGGFFGPTTIRAMTKMMSSSYIPRPNMGHPLVCAPVWAISSATECSGRLWPTP